MAIPHPTHHHFIDRTGQRFGRLVVLEFAGRVRDQGIAWKCQCDCGATCVVAGKLLHRGVRKSCGCYPKGRPVIHGVGNYDKQTPEYRAWLALKNRCTNRNSPDWKHYGGRGIKVCDRWLHSFPNFLADMGSRPSDKNSLDRVNNDGDYEPGNCRWATHAEQQNNKRNCKRITWQGETLTVLEWSRKLGIATVVIYKRLSAGWSAEAILGKNGH